MLDFTPLVMVPDDEATAIQVGGDFEVSYWPKRFTRRTRVGILQLIRPLTDVGAYHANRTPSGWAVDKHAADTAGVKRVADCLPYGVVGYTPRQVGPRANMRFGDGGTEAILRDTPREIVPLRDAMSGSTKFAEYAVDVKNERIFDEGIQWSYSGTVVGMTYEAPHVVRLSKSKDHRLAIVHFLCLCGIVISEVRISAMTRG
jgi:hypothetical protein